MLAENVIEWGEAWKDSFWRTAWEDGWREGMHEGKVELMQQLLTYRCGPLPDWALPRLQQGSEGELSRWCLRVLDYSTLQEILN